MSITSLGIAGAGRMGAALLKGWANARGQGFAPKVTVFEPHLSQDIQPVLQALEASVNPGLAQPLDVLIWRRGSSPHFRSLAALEAAALDGLAQGLSFAALCQALSERFPETDIASEAGGLLRRWVEEGLLAGLTRGQ